MSEVQAHKHVPPRAPSVPGTDQQPPLTLPSVAADAVREAYADASVILEYGSGGSTVIASELGKTVFSVESDRRWLDGMQGWFDANPGSGNVILHHADIGPTGNWGYPKTSTGFRRWPLYATSVWDRPDFQHPDVVLIDGRFRAACFLTVLFRITRPVTVLWDDYEDRASYHEMEEFCPRMGMIGRMAIFNAEPTPVPADKLGLILTTYLRAE